MAGALLAATVPAHAQGSAEDEQAIRKVMQGYTETWDRHDMRVWSQLFAEDADFVVMTGKYLKGRAEIEAYHTALHAGVYKDVGSSGVPSLAVRFLRPDVAIVRVSAEITYNEGKGNRTAAAVLVVTKHGQQWLIDTAQSTLAAGTPVAPNSGVK